jgi:tetratricopeptide (TPR) repeat protein
VTYASATLRFSNAFIGVLLGVALNLLMSASAQAAEEADRHPALGSAEATAQYHVLAGEMAAGRKMPELAAQEFLQALDVVADPQLASRATSLALAAHNDDLALLAAKRWLEVESNSLDAREVITLLSLRKGLLTEAHEQCAAIVRDHPGGEADGFRHVALLLAPESAHGDAVLALIQQLVTQWPNLAGAHYALGLAAVRFNQLPLAEKAAHEALRLEPASTDAQLLLAGIQVKKGELDAADQTMDGVLRRSPNPSDLRMGYARLLLESEQRDRARKQLKAILAAEPGEADARYALGLMALEDQQLEEASRHFTILAAKGDRRNEAAYYLGRIEEIQNRPDKALMWYERVEGGSQGIDAAVRSVLMLGRLKRVEQARTGLEELRRQFPMLVPRFFAIEGELLLSAGQAQAALQLYDAALIDRPDDSDLLYGRSLTQEKLGRIDLAEADLRRVLEVSKEDARALNALGYLLTLHSDRLDEARQLLSRALELEPEDASVIDSMGWLQFRLGNLGDARTLLQKAYDKASDPEIAAHLGEVLWALGEKDQARAVWQTALQDAPDHEVLRETVDRLGR